MNERERFNAIVQFEKPDYVPIFAMHGSPGASGGPGTREACKRLIEGGMPEWVNNLADYGTPKYIDHGSHCLDNWHKYWGTTLPLSLDFFPAEPSPPLKTQKRVEGEYEIIEDEAGAITRQVIDNDVTYSMPEFIRYSVIDRASYYFYREKTKCGPRWPAEKIEKECRRFDDREKPLAIWGGATWGGLRSMMGPEVASTILYDDPGLVTEIMEDQMHNFKTYFLPLIERLRPEIVFSNEDCCYNHGMFLSPGHFQKFFASFYRMRNELIRDCGVDMLVIDSDGNVMEYTGLVEECGINAICPCEVKAGNDIFALRKQHPECIFMGGLEKEIVNEGNGHFIAQEVRSKVPPLLEKGGYFPNLDHSLQPPVTFENLCKFMTLLHEVTGNPDGEFPRMK